MKNNQTSYFQTLHFQSNLNTMTKKQLKSNSSNSSSQIKYSFQKISKLYFQLLKKQGINQNHLQSLYKQLQNHFFVPNILSLDGSLRKSTFKQVIDDYQMIENDLMETPCDFLDLMCKYEDKQKNKKIKEIQQNKRIKQELHQLRLLGNDFRTTRKQMVIKKLQNKQQFFKQKYQQIFYQQCKNFKYMKTIYGHRQKHFEEQFSFTPIYQVTYDSTGKFIFTADDQGVIKIWNADTGLLLSNLKGHLSHIQFIKVSQCDKYLLSNSADNFVRIWKINQEKCCANFRFQSQVKCATFHTYKNILYVIIVNKNALIFIQETNFNKNNGIYKSNQEYSYQIELQLFSNAISLHINKYNQTLIGTQNGTIFLIGNPQFGIMIKQLDNHVENCHEILWNKQGNRFLSASFDGTCKFWKFNQVDFQVELITSLNGRFKNIKNKQVNCWSIQFSVNCKYFFTTFSKEIKGLQKQKAQSKIIVFNTKEQIIQAQIRKNQFLKMQSLIYFIRSHPKQQMIAFYADMSGQIVIFDIYGNILNIFHQKGYHIRYPNLQIGILNGCFSPDGSSLVVTSQYGCFSIYANSIKDFYKICPSQQFFVSDFQIFALNQDFLPISTEVSLEMNNIQRGDICNIKLVPYTFRYTNKMKQIYWNYDKNGNDNKGMYESEYIKTIGKQIKERNLQQMLYENAYNLEQKQRKKIIIEQYELKIQKKQQMNIQEQLQIQEDPIKNNQSQGQTEQKKSLTKQKHKFQIQEQSLQLEKFKREYSQIQEDQIIIPRKKRRNLQDDQVQNKCFRCKVILQKNIHNCQCQKIYCNQCYLHRKINQKCFCCYKPNLENKLMFQNKKLKRGQLQSDHIAQIYIPQCKDKVYFISEGYQEYIKNYIEYIGGLIVLQNGLPMDIQPELSKDCLCVIQQINYEFPMLKVKQSKNTIKQILLVMKLKYKHFYFNIFCHVSQLSNILVPKAVYQTSLEQMKLVRKDQIKTIYMSNFVLIEIGYFDVQIIDISKNIKYKSIKIVVLRTGVISRRFQHFQYISPWNLINKPIYSNICESKIKNIIGALKKIQKIQPYYLFQNSIDLNQYSDYQNYVPIMMFINKIISRLQNRYYRSVQHIRNDFRIMIQNVGKYSPQQSYVCKVGQELHQKLNFITQNCNNRELLETELLEKKRKKKIINYNQQEEEKIEKQKQNVRITRGKSKFLQ